MPTVAALIPQERVFPPVTQMSIRVDSSLKVGGDWESSQHC
jgi:hypothetical protein